MLSEVETSQTIAHYDF